MTQKSVLGSGVFVRGFLSILSFGFCAPAFAQLKSVGYYAAWKSAILPYNKVQYSSLTHVLVAFAYPNANGTISSDTGIPFGPLVQSAHAAGKKVLIALGGAAKSTQFAAATADSAMRATFITNIVSFLQTNSYDGVDIDWETPANATETAQVTAFVQEMRTRFNLVNASWLISMAVPPTNWGGQHFDYPNLLSNVDWFNVMCYDFYGSWSGYAGHNSPLYQSPSDPTQAGSDTAAVVYMVSRGVPKAKLALGIPFYSVQFSATGLYQQMTAPTTSNPVYSDVVNYLATGWTYHWDDVSKVPYLLNSASTQFVTYEDTISIKLKAGFAQRQQVGGLMCWELAQGVLADGSQPLLDAMATFLKTPTGVEEKTRIPTAFALYDNFPNPFNPSTTIRFDLRENSRVKLEIVNLLGQEIATFDFMTLEAGPHQQPIDLFRFPTGVYLYRLTTETTSGERLTAAKRMLLIK